MHFEKLEARRLLSVTPAPVAASLTHHAGAADVIHIEPQKKAKISLNDVIQAITVFNRAKSLLTRKVSGHQVLTQAGHFLLDSTNPVPLFRVAATTAGPSYTLTIATASGTDDFDPSFIDPFPATYTFNLNTKKPLNLFNISQKIGSDKLKFTGVMSQNLQEIKGVLSVTGPNRKLVLNYTLTSDPLTP